MEQLTKSQKVHMDVFPTREQVAAWNNLSRVEQVEQIRQELKEAYESGPSSATREEIRAAALKKVAEIKAQRNPA